MRAITKVVWSGLVVAAFSVLRTTHAGAQAHSAGAARSVRSTPVRAGSVRPVARVGTPLKPNCAPLRTVPGLSLNLRPLVATGQRGFGRARGQYVTPFLGYYPFYSPYADYAYDVQPPYDYAPPQQAEPPALPAPIASSQESSANLELQSPPPEVGQLVLVRLDGQVLFASAFMTVDGRITYVTREGLRRSFPISELDKDATRQMNEANGTNVSLPE